MELNEAIETLEGAGFIVEDTKKYDLDVFTKIKIHGAKIVENPDSVEINGQAFRITVYDDLSVNYNLLFRDFGAWQSYGVKYKETILEKTPEEIKKIFQAKMKDLRWKAHW